MADLCELTCQPCHSGADPLAGEQLAEYAKQAPHWQVVDEHHIVRTFKFADFAAALAFVNSVGELAEQLGHHPHIILTWGRVQVKSFTHKIDGLHVNDFILATHIDRLPGAED